MQRPEGEAGRRPLLLGNNRQILQQIRDNLQHLQKNPQPSESARGIDSQFKGDISQSTPNLLEKMGNGGKMNRLGYNKKAMAKIRQSLANYQIQGEASPGLQLLGPNGMDMEAVPVNVHMLQQLKQMGWDEEIASHALKRTGNKSVDAALLFIQKVHMDNIEDRNGFDMVGPGFPLPGYGAKVIRKPSFEEKYGEGSPAQSENSSVRSESPSMNIHAQYLDSSHHGLNNGPSSLKQNERQSPPPPLPPRGVPPSHNPPPPPPLPAQVWADENITTQQVGVMKMTPSVYARDSTGLPATSARVTLGNSSNSHASHSHQIPSPVSGRQQPVIKHNIQHTLNQPHYQTDCLQEGQPQLNVPYVQPPPYLPSNKPSPSSFGPFQMHEQSHMIVPQFQGNSSPLSHSPSPGRVPSPAQNPSSALQMYGQGVGTSPGSPSGHVKSPAPMPLQAWGAKQSRIVMQKVNSREVQKPILQTATAPPIPQHLQQQQMLPIISQQMTAHNQSAQKPELTNFVSSVQAQINGPPSQPPPLPQPLLRPMRDVQIEITRPPLPSYRLHVNNSGQKIHINSGPTGVRIQNYILENDLGCTQHAHLPQKHMAWDPNNPTSRSESPVSRATNQSPISMISSVSTPSTNSDIPDKPPPPYPGRPVQTHIQVAPNVLGPNYYHSFYSPAMAVGMEQPWSTTEDSSSQQSHPPDITSTDTDDQQSTNSENTADEWDGKRLCSSPKPLRKPEAEKKDLENRETKIRHFSPQAYKFFMEQRVENLLKSHQQRIHRRMQLEKEMAKVGLSEEAQEQMRKMLYQKESNYIRLKRAKMEKAMFDKIKTLGVGAFGEVALVRKIDTGHLYAMKTLRKNDVLQRNQAAHVKAERDILAEADNEWVVKLYYSFQDKDNLYFVMDYIPGGDMMSLLIKFGIFKEPLACFYIAELVVAIESVHKMGFIHRDIKPDNILIDKDGHIKLTDFGLCTGFRWTHNSKYYQKGNHLRQDSMEPDESWGQNCECHSKKELLKPLERRKHRHKRCLANSLVGTPNYIAPEVLLRSGYTSCCDWWSVGVILYEMLVGQPPFLAKTPQETQYKVIKWEDTLRIPEEARLSQESQDLILRLCCGPEERLGGRGSADIKKHPFFQNISFQDLRRQPAPYQPKIRYATDTSNFDPVDPERMRNSSSDDSVDPHTSGLENGKHPEHAFFEFTFRRFFDDGGHPYAIKLKDPETNAPVYV